LTAEEIAERLRRHRPGVRRAPDDGSATHPRGDFELNPEFREMNAQSRAAAVLVPIVDREAGPSLLLTVRTTHLKAHAGQIAFPGGRLEPEDSGPVDTALRETEEEIGLSRSHVRPIGELDLYLTRTGFSVTPVVALIEPPFTLQPDPGEVAEIFEVPLAFVLDPLSRQIHQREDRGAVRHFYVYPYGDYYIWGATAGMLNNLAEVLGGT